MCRRVGRYLVSGVIGFVVSIVGGFILQAMEEIHVCVGGGDVKRCIQITRYSKEFQQKPSAESQQEDTGE